MPPPTPTPNPAVGANSEAPSSPINNNNASGSGQAQELSPLEREVLEEYALLLENLDKVISSFISFSYVRLDI